LFRTLLGDWFLRVNPKTGGCIEIAGTKETVWWTHPSEKETVDVAVTPLMLPDGAECNCLPERIFIDEAVISQYGVGAGDEVYVTGLFARAPGRLRNLPIVRTGNISLIPVSGELIPGIEIDKGRSVDAEVYLVEARSIGGISGSPAFARMTIAEKRLVTLANGERREMVCTFPGEFFLLGLVHGHWRIHPKDKNEPNWAAVQMGKEEDAVNLGIAVIVPANKIKETLYHPGLVSMRDEQDRLEKEARGTTTVD
jgi:hypothetical protein